MSNTSQKEAIQIATKVHKCALDLSRADGGLKDAVLNKAADSLLFNAKRIIAANQKDIDAASMAGLSSAMIDRLMVDKTRIESMVEGLRQVVALPDPVGQVIDGYYRPNGLFLSRIRVPIGVLLVIFESRPNVTIDSAALGIKSGNVMILRGGKEAKHTNQALGWIMAESLKSVGLPTDAMHVVQNTDRDLVTQLLKLNEQIDVVIPRGGKGLIQAITKHSTIPVIKHLDGICHVYVDAAADLDMAQSIAVNAKVQRPGVCNAMETLIVHREVADKFLPACLKEMSKLGVELRGDNAVRDIAKDIEVGKVSNEDWVTEYLGLVLSVAIVDDIDHAIRHINKYGSKHTDAIITRDIVAANRFKCEVDSSSVMVNASTRFSDGFEYGLGAEIGISTNKLHARGPVGLEGLTTYKWIVEGDGQVRS